MTEEEDYSEIFREFFELEDINKILSELKLEDVDETSDALPLTTTFNTSGQQIPVLTGRREAHYTAITYREKIISRSLKLEVEKHTAFVQQVPTTAQNIQQTSDSQNVQEPSGLYLYSTPTANQSAGLLSHGNSSHKNENITKQYHREPSQNFLHSSASSTLSLRAQDFNQSSQVNRPILPHYQEFPNEFVQDSSLNFQNCATTSNSSVQYPPSQFPYINTSAQFPYSCAQSHQQAQFLQSVVQSNFGSSNLATGLDFAQLAYNNLTANQSDQFPYNSSLYNETIRNECHQPSQHGQTLNSQVPKYQSQCNYLSHTSATQEFSSQYVQDRFQNCPSSKSTTNSNIQFPSAQFQNQNGSALVDRNGQALQFLFQNSSALPTQNGRLPSYKNAYLNKIKVERKKVDRSYMPYNVKTPQRRAEYRSQEVPYDPVAYNNTVGNTFCQPSHNTNHCALFQYSHVPYNNTVGNELRHLAHNSLPPNYTVSANLQVQFMSSQRQYEPMSAYPSAQPFFLNNNGSTMGCVRKKKRDRR